MDKYLLRDWTFFSLQIYGSSKTMDYESAVSSSSIPALTQRIRELKEYGFFINTDEILVWKSVATKYDNIKITFNIGQTCYFRNGETTLEVHIFSKHCESIEEAIENTTCTNVILKYDGNPVEMGMGQARKCKKIADEIWQKWGHFAPCLHSVVVPYETRGGRGGWKKKIAHRTFHYSPEQP